MIDREHDLSITKQGKVLQISRGSVYYLPRPVSDADLAIMRRLDRLHREFPLRFANVERPAGCRGVQDRSPACQNANAADGDRSALSPSPYPEPGHKIYPYLLRGMAITRPNQVWAMDITTSRSSAVRLPRRRTRLATRRVLSWRLSITMEAAFYVETLEDALARHGKPEIFNTDQGSQFTSSAFTGLLASNGIAISMDGKGAWRDNVFVERLWRSVKYEECTCGPTKASARRASRSADTSLQWPDRIRALTTPHRIKPTSTNRHSAWRPNLGRRSTYRRFCSDNRNQLSKHSLLST
jgi:putative transposase